MASYRGWSLFEQYVVSADRVFVLCNEIGMPELLWKLENSISCLKTFLFG